MSDLPPYQPLDKRPNCQTEVVPCWLVLMRVVVTLKRMMLLMKEHEDPGRALASRLSGCCQSVMTAIAAPTGTPISQSNGLDQLQMRKLWYAGMVRNITAAAVSPIPEPRRNALRSVVVIYMKM